MVKLCFKNIKIPFFSKKMQSLPTSRKFPRQVNHHSTGKSQKSHCACHRSDRSLSQCCSGDAQGCHTSYNFSQVGWIWCDKAPLLRVKKRYFWNVCGFLRVFLYIETSLELSGRRIFGPLDVPKKPAHLKNPPLTRDNSSRSPKEHVLMCLCKYMYIV